LVLRFGGSRNSKKTITANSFESNVAELKDAVKAKLAEMGEFVQPNHATLNFA